MYFTLFTTTLVFALAILRVQADFTVNTVELTQCQPATLGWDSTTNPYDVIVVSSNDPCGDALVDLGYIDTNTFQWPKVPIAAGTQVMISIMDKNDQEGWSGSITVKSSNDSSCLASQYTSPNSSPNPSHSSPSNNPPTPTIVGAANNGLISGGESTFHFSGIAVAVTAFGALVALL